MSAWTPPVFGSIWTMRDVLLPTPGAPRAGAATLCGSHVTDVDMRLRALATALAGAAIGLAPVWWHVDVVDPGIDNIIAVFREVAIYPTDVCLAGLAVIAIVKPVPLDVRTRWIAVGLVLLASVALVSSLPSREPILGAALAGHLALLALAWLGVRSGQVSRRALILVLVASAAIQSVVAFGQFTLQQT